MKTLLLFIVLLSVIALIHEFGHFIVAKIFGVYVEEFSVGMGPKIFQIKGKETKYSFRAILLGGYVALAGDTGNPKDEDNAKVEVPKERTLPGVHPIKRILIMLAGIFMNIVLAIVVCSIVLMAQGKTVAPEEPRINEVVDNTPAYQAGFKDNDYIEKISLSNGLYIVPNDYSEVSYFLSLYDGNGNLSFRVNRDGEIKNIDVKPEFNDEENRYLIGINFGETEIIDVNFFSSFKYAIKDLFSMTKILLITLAGLFRGYGLNNLSGPIGIYQVTDQAAQYGFLTFLNLLGMLSLNVGIMNALPIPLFDGGRVVLTIIEMIIGKPINKKVETICMVASILFVILLFVVATYQDVLRIFG